jgi:hypothetical protein
MRTGRKNSLLQPRIIFAEEVKVRNRNEEMLFT